MWGIPSAIEDLLPSDQGLGTIESVNQILDKGKSKVLPITDREDLEGEKMHRSTLPSTSALDGGGWLTPRPGRFTHKKDRVPIVYDAGWASGPVWTGEENLAPPPGFDPRTVLPVASRYTD